MEISDCVTRLYFREPPDFGISASGLLEKTQIVASIDLHIDAFQPRNGTQTSVLILQKKTQEEINEERYTRRIVPYNIFMAMVEKVGHDRRGNTLFKRDEEGNEIWVSEENASPVNYQNTEEASADIQTERKTRVIDDQSSEVPRLFAKWKKEEGYRVVTQPEGMPKEKPIKWASVNVSRGH